jgi:uncharacterized 2Fe-2S/4Fe-4S cluster protein (DUF4445 family)
MTPLIDFEPVGRRGEYRKGDSLLECARSLGVELVNICGGEGTCGGCVVQVLAGKTSPITESEREFITEEKLAEGYRLACRAVPASDCKVRVPAESLTTRQRTQVEGQEVPVVPDPVAKSYLLAIEPPSLDDLRSDARRLAEKLAEEHGVSDIDFDLCVLRSLPDVLRDNHWRVKVILYNHECIAVMPKSTRPLGVAVDLGTTKIALYLMDLESGQTLATKGMMNPQVAHGEDIVTRMAATQKDPTMAAHFQAIIVEALNEAMAEICTGCQQDTSQIVNIVLVGNTAMHHLFLGLPVRQLGRAPYVPAVSSALEIKARDLGLAAASGAYVHLLPNIAGYVGADHVAMLLATGMQTKTGVALAIDIGTNTEICLADHGTLTSLSTASGPAFEGAYIKYGMRAADGAIERFQIIDGKIKYQTIENTPAIGLCGSGILDVLAQLLLNGVVNRQGRMGDHLLVRGDGKEREFVIVPGSGNGNEVTFTQKDVEQLQLAKGAIRTGIEVLLSRNKLSKDDIAEIILAGAFGTYLDVSSAIAIGMLPDIPREKIHQVGNAAGMGAKLALISEQKREEAKEMARKVNYIELAGDPSFMRTFAKAMRLG